MYLLNRDFVYGLLVGLATAALFILLTCLGGCASTTEQAVTPRITATDEAVVDAPTISEMERFAELGSKIEEMSGNVTMTRQGISEMQKELEETRLEVTSREHRIGVHSSDVVIVGVILVALVAKNVFGPLMTKIAVIAGVGCIVVGKLLPLLFALW